MKFKTSGGRIGFRRYQLLPVLISMSVLVGVLPATAEPIDTTSTEGVHILTVPVPDVIVDGQVESAPYNPVGISDDSIALTLFDPEALETELLFWPGIGYPQPVGEDFPVGWDLISPSRMNSSGTIVGSFQIESDFRGFAWSETNGFIEVEPPSVAENVGVTVSGIAETGWITGTVWSVADTCSPTEDHCGFVGIPNGAGYDYMIFSERFTPRDIELVSLGGGPAEHVVVGGQHFVGGELSVWSESGGFASLDNGGGEGDVVTALDVNQSGQIVGSIITDVEPPPPPPELPPPPEPPLAAYWASPASAVDVLSPLPGHDTVSPRSLNASGTVVGVSRISETTTQSAFVWNPGDSEASDLGHLTGGTPFSSAISINDAGQILGSSGGRAVIWDLTGSYDINYPPTIHLEELVAHPVFEGQLLEFRPFFEDTDGDPLEVQWVDLPSGATFDPQTGNISWQTQAGDAGIYTPTLMVSEVNEPANVSSATVTLEVQQLQSGEYSSTGIRVHWIPTSPFPGAPALQPEHINDNGWVVLGSPFHNDNSWWDGSGYPETDIGCDSCSGFTIEDINNDNTMVGSYVGLDGLTRGYVRTEENGFADVGEPPSFLAGATTSRIEVLGIDDEARITGTFTSSDWCPGDFRENAGSPPAFGVQCMYIAVPPAGGAGYTFVTLPSLTPSTQEHPDPDSLIGALSGVVDVQNGIVLGRNWTWSAPTEGEPPATRYQMLNTTGGVGAFARDINNSGQIAGMLDRNDQDLTIAPAFWQTPASNPEQFLLPGDTNGSANGINDAGWVAGHSEPGRFSSDGTAILYKSAGEELIDLGRLGTTQSFAIDVNNNGLVAGVAGGKPSIWDLDDDYAINYPPEVINPNNFRGSANAGEELDYSATITDPEGDPFEVSWLVLPEGAGPAGGSGLEWQTSPGDEGVYRATMLVRQDGERVFTMDIDLVVYGPSGEPPVDYHGLVWDDFDGDGQFEPPLEDPIPNVFVYLDLNDDGLPGVGEPLGTTGPDGSYSLSTDATKPLTVRQVVPDGYHQTSPQGGWVRDPFDGDVAGLDFGNRPDADGDLDGDGIDNGIDVLGDPLTYLHLNFSAFFDDAIASGGMTSGRIVNYGGLEVVIEDNPFPHGVKVSTNGPGNEFAEIEHCGFSSSYWGVTVTGVTCGSLMLDVLEGRVTTLTSDGASVEVLTGSSVTIEDDGTTVTIEVVSGSATVTVGETTITLEEGEAITDPGTTLGGRDTLAELDALDELVVGLDPGVWANNGASRAAQSIIADMEDLVIDDDLDEVAALLSNFERHLDGCDMGDGPDKNDWILDCESQALVRVQIKVVAATLPPTNPFEAV